MWMVLGFPPSHKPWIAASGPSSSQLGLNPLWLQPLCQELQPPDFPCRKFTIGHIDHAIRPPLAGRARAGPYGVSRRIGASSATQRDADGPWSPVAPTTFGYKR
jgi:hypothetical protein